MATSTDWYEVIHVHVNSLCFDPFLLFPTQSEAIDPHKSAAMSRN